MNHATNRKLIGEIDETMAALARMDRERLEAVEHRLQSMSAEHLAASLARERNAAHEVLEKQLQLRRLLDATAANLKVLASVLSLKMQEEAQREEGSWQR